MRIPKKELQYDPLYKLTPDITLIMENNIEEERPEEIPEVEETTRHEKWLRRE